MNIYIATKLDIEIIGRLAQVIWHEHYTPIIGKGQVDFMLNKLYSPQALEIQLEDGQLFYIIQRDGIPFGFISISEKSTDELFLNKFYILSSEQGKGLGAQVFLKLMATYPKIKIMRLQVNRSNFKSINFYFKLGFIIEEVADFDIGDGYFMNDFIMLKKF